MRLLLSQACALVGSLLLAVPVAAQAPADFFKDKQMRVLVGHPPGGSYDFYARLAADMLKVAMPQVRSIVVENKPGGGGVVATAYFYAQAPRDGTVLAVFPETIANTQILEPDVAKWKVEDMRYIGSFTPANSVFVRRRNSPNATLDDMKQRETVVGCTGTTAQSFQYPAMLKVLGGYKFKMICGYPGANEYTLALDRGEIDLVSSAWSSWRVTSRTQLDKGDLVAMIQAGLKRHKELPDVPLMQELVADPAAKRAIEFASAGSDIGRALLAPPGIPDDRIAYLRSVFDKMVKDPALIEMAEQRHLELDPAPGAEVQGYAEKMIATPPDIVELVSKAFKG